jgi:hypothetical protein
MKTSICEICFRSISNNNFRKHILSCKGIRTPKIRGVDYDPNHGYANGNRSIWNKGLTKENSSAVKSASEKNTGKKRPNMHSVETKSKLSAYAKDRGLGGYRPHPNRGKYYKDTWFDSHWEVKVAESLDENNISWVRPKTGFIWNESGNKYYPDFFLPEFGVYLDPKNPYLMIKDSIKLQNASEINDIIIIPLNEDQLTWSKIFPLINAA